MARCFPTCANLPAMSAWQPRNWRERAQPASARTRSFVHWHPRIVFLPLVLTLYLSVFDETLIVLSARAAIRSRWYAGILPTFGGALRTSLVTAGARSLPPSASSIGVPAAIALSRNRFRGRDAISTLLLAPLTIPGVAIGLGIYVLAVLIEERTELAARRHRPAVMVAAHVLITLPWVVRLVPRRPGQRTTDPPRKPPPASAPPPLTRYLARHPARHARRHHRRRPVRLHHLLRKPRDDPLPHRPRHYDAAHRRSSQYLQYHIDPLGRRRRRRPGRSRRRRPPPAGPLRVPVARALA